MSDTQVGFYAVLAICFLLFLVLALVIARWLQSKGS